MRPRCVELARVLKETGSFYYHCDWHASHYVKVMFAQILGENNFQNEIVWKRTSSHSDARCCARRRLNPPSKPAPITVGATATRGWMSGPKTPTFQSKEKFFS
jgi:DNA modification methylase